MIRVVSRNRKGFTLIELLVTIAVISLLIGLLLPAVQSARESARRITCQNNLKQLSMGVLQAESTYGRFPSNGWGWKWMGDPDRGYGKRQTGGWIYQILPYIDQAALQDIGAGDPPPLKRLRLGDLTQKSFPLVRCPTRPADITCPRDPVIEWWNAELRNNLARTDYAGNAGDLFTGIKDGPSSLSEGDSKAYAWPDNTNVTGILFQRSEIRTGDITDGMSNTYLLGEKCAGKGSYSQYGDQGFDQSFLAGDDWDLVRWTEKAPQMDGATAEPERFGSAHSSIFNVALCDGSVRAVSYSIDLTTHRHLGNRSDGEVTGPY
jgi:prepilin-type N-terminal cleavage/methylation domain-containing protein